MKIYYFFILLINILCNSPQETTKELWQADIEIVINGDYEAALDIYKYNFQFNKGQLSGSSFNNMLEISKYINDTMFLSEVRDYAVSRGLCHNHVMFTNLREQELYSEVNDSTFVLLNELLVLLDIDQGARVNYDDPGNIRKTDSLNFIRFKELGDEFGYPSFDNIDLRCFSENRGLRHPSVIRTLILHFSQGKIKGISEILNDALASNQIAKSDFMQYAEYSEVDPCPNILIEWNEGYYKLKRDASQISKIEEARNQIGYMSFFQQLELEISYYKNRDALPFEFHPSIVTYTYSDLPEEIINTRFIKVF